MILWLKYCNLNLQITNNASESENSRWKKLIGKKRDIYEAVLIAYLHMTNILDEIQTALRGKIYKCTVKDEFLESLGAVDFHDTSDVTGELGLEKIFKSGRFSNKITEFVPHTQIRLSVQGLASYLYKTPGRIIFLCGEYFVRKIGGGICHVRLVSTRLLLGGINDSH